MPLIKAGSQLGDIYSNQHKITKGVKQIIAPTG
jgi:hypothetical protein